ncbi:hypothetical protein DFN09_002528 [Clostridium acetobutylicum]|nr:hypothetical protein [Clostridium acetobutylicum]
MKGISHRIAIPLILEVGNNKIYNIGQIIKKREF